MKAKSKIYKAKEKLKGGFKANWGWYLIVFLVPFGWLLWLVFDKYKAKKQASEGERLASRNSLTGSNLSTVASFVKPVFANGFPKIELNHVKINIVNTGVFEVIIKDTNGSIFQTDSITAPSNSDWLSNVLKHDGKVYEVLVNGYSYTVIAPNDSINDAPWVYEDLAN